MSIESQARIPREGTNRYKVLLAIQEGIPVWDTKAIANKTGLPTRQVTIARANLRSDGRLPKPTPELTWLAMHSQAAKILPLVREYREMGLSPREIQFAVRTEKEAGLSYESVRSAIAYGTRVGNLRRLSEEEKQDIWRDSNVNTLTNEEASEKVIKILEFRKWLLENNQPLPTNRLEWKRDVGDDFYKSRGLPLPTLTDFNREDIKFADRLIWSRFIEKDNITFFETLKRIYNARGKDFDNFSPEIKLRLEAFVSAIMQEVKERKTDLRSRFIEFGLQLGKEWFYNKDCIAVKEQKFIGDKIRNGNI